MIKPNSIQEFLRLTDFELLKEQKDILIDIQTRAKDVEDVRAIAGILEFLSGIQDLAVDVYHFKEEEVFIGIGEEN